MSARTLADYRPQHDQECDQRRCLICGGLLAAIRGSQACRCVGLPVQMRKPCSCGLDALLASVAASGEQGEQKKSFLVVHCRRALLAEPSWTIRMYCVLNDCEDAEAELRQALPDIAKRDGI